MTSSLTDATIQTANSTTYFEKNQKTMQQDLETFGTNPTNENHFDCSCVSDGKCPFSTLMTKLTQQVNLLENQVKKIQNQQEILKIQQEYSLFNLDKLGIPIDEQSIRDFNDWSCGNHYDL